MLAEHLPEHLRVGQEQGEEREAAEPEERVTLVLETGRVDVREPSRISYDPATQRHEPGQRVRTLGLEAPLRASGLGGEVAGEPVHTHDAREAEWQPGRDRAHIARANERCDEIGSDSTG